MNQKLLSSYRSADFIPLLATLAVSSTYACFNKGGAVCIVFVFMVVAFTINVVVTHECKLAFVSCIVMMSSTELYSIALCSLKVNSIYGYGYLRV